MPIDFTEYDELPEPCNLVTIDNEFQSFYDQQLNYGKTNIILKVDTIFYLKSYYAEKFHKEIVTEKFLDPEWYAKSITPFICDGRCWVTNKTFKRQESVKIEIIDPNYNFI